MSRLRSRRLIIQRSGTGNYMSRPISRSSSGRRRWSSALTPPGGMCTAKRQRNQTNFRKACDRTSLWEMRRHGAARGSHEQGSAFYLVQLQHVTFGRKCACGYSRLAGSPLRQTGEVVTGVGLCLLFVRSFLERFGDDDLFRPRSVPTCL